MNEASSILDGGVAVGVARSNNIESNPNIKPPYPLIQKFSFIKVNSDSGSISCSVFLSYQECLFLRNADNLVDFSVLMLL